MLQDAQIIRFYQRLTDALNDQWQRGYRFDELRLYLDGYLAALRHSNVVEPYLIHQLEEEATRYLYDPSSFIEPQPQPEVDFY
ncbi:MAG: hypothetical protein Fur0046_36140 [Cyanobacteria bacterium J069]|nr:MAG: hypothetical protein D6742_09655 [Cyanobacteria bacterium J069]